MRQVYRRLTFASIQSPEREDAHGDIIVACLSSGMGDSLRITEIGKAAAQNGCKSRLWGVGFNCLLASLTEV